MEGCRKGGEKHQGKRWPPWLHKKRAFSARKKATNEAFSFLSAHLQAGIGLKMG